MRLPISERFQIEIQMQLKEVAASNLKFEIWNLKFA
jgi:hypothetical protein